MKEMAISSPRIGIGYDVHSLRIGGQGLVLGGVRIPHEKEFVAHSDGDVLVHAICDAILGALALGDIGVHFPDTDPQYKGVSSIKLLEHCIALMNKHGYSIGNIDCVISAQKPKLKPYIPMMREELAKAMGCNQDAVSVKATTTEQLGFEGREEGISSQAVVLLIASC